MTDLDELVARARHGDREALESVLAHVAPAVHRFGLRMCKNVHDADDVLQDTLMNVVAHLGTFEGRSSLSSWAFALARSACVRKRRGLKNQPPVSDERMLDTPDPAADPERRASDQELAQALSNALAGLSDEHREAILLRDMEGLSAPESAAVLGVSVDALKSRLHRAREALRVALRPVLEPVVRPAGPARCPDVVALWSTKLEGDLQQRDCAEMEAHVAGCVACRSACDALKTALVACQSARTSDVPPDVRAQITSALETMSA